MLEAQSTLVKVFTSRSYAKNKRTSSKKYFRVKSIDVQKVQSRYQQMYFNQLTESSFKVS